jgi:hypothetical protein
MRLRRLRYRAAVASTLATAALAMTLMLNGGVAGAFSITPPPFPGGTASGAEPIGAYPLWLTNNYQMSNIDHSEGSDTTLFMMQTIGDLYTDAGLFPFGCFPTTNNSNCITQTAYGSNPDGTQTDVVDNWNSDEILNGISNVGSVNGQEELCGTNVPTSGTQTVDFARSSKPPSSSSAGCTVLGVGYAKDGVTPVDFPTVEPGLYNGKNGTVASPNNTPTGYEGQAGPGCATGSYLSYNQSNGASICTPFPGTAGSLYVAGPHAGSTNTTQGIGPVAAGWLPGDSFTCDQDSSCSGTPLTDLENVSPGGLSSVAFRLWCAHGSSLTPNESQIMDWGNLTNLDGGSVAVGSGAPIGVPIRIIGVNPGSGTASTFNNFLKSGLGGSNNCATGPTNGSGDNFNANAASGPNPQVNQGDAPTNLETALENDAAQIGDFAASDWGSSDPADQAIDIATSLYYMGNGAYTANNFSGISSLEITNPNNTLIPSTLPTSFVSQQLTVNGVTANPITEYQNQLPTARTLFNVYRPDKVRASVAGFLNWMCDTNPATSGGASGTTAYSSGGLTAKETDHTTGGNYDTDLTNIIDGQYGFARLDDATPELKSSAQTTENGVSNPNASCDASATISTISTTSNQVTLSSLPANVAVGWEVATAPGFSPNINYPASNSNGVTTTNATTITGISGNTLTLSQDPVSSTGGIPTTLYFPGHPPILTVASANLGS